MTIRLATRGVKGSSGNTLLSTTAAVRPPSVRDAILSRRLRFDANNEAVVRRRCRGQSAPGDVDRDGAGAGFVYLQDAGFQSSSVGDTVTVTHP